MVALRDLDPEPFLVPGRHAGGEREALVEDEAWEREWRFDEYETMDSRVSYAAEGGIE